MIKGNKLKELSAKTILSLVSSYDIYRHYLGKDIVSGNATLSPFRDEDDPSFVVTYSREGEWLHCDYGDSQKRGNCFQFVEQLYGVNYNGALERIDSDMQLGIREKNNGEYKAIIASYKRPKIDVRRETIIQVKPRKWNSEELDYWNVYGIGKEALKEAKDPCVYVPQELWISKKRIAVKNKLCFCYLFQNKWWKIYFPYASKEEKWKSNVPIDCMYGLDNIKSCDKAIVTKSVKDMLALQQIYGCVAGCQNESVVAINERNIEYLRANAKEVYIAFDSDAPGKQNSWFYTKNYGFKHLNTPDRLLSEGVKDFSGWIALEGVEIVKEHLIKKGIL